MFTANGKAKKQYNLYGGNNALLFRSLQKTNLTPFAKVGTKHKCNTNSSKPIQANQNNRQQISKIEINIMQTECISITLLSEGILERRINSDTTTRTVQVQR